MNKLKISGIHLASILVIAVQYHDALGVHAFN
jgi:hypothetical protein